MVKFASPPTDIQYSHWHQTGAEPARPNKPDALDTALAFEQYRHTVVSAWPEGEAKREHLRVIERALERLRQARAGQRQH